MSHAVANRTQSPPAHWAAHESAAVDHPEPRGWLKSLYKVAEALFCAPEGPPPPARLRWLCAEVDDFTARVGSRSRKVFRLSLFLVVWIAPLLLLRPLPARFGSVERRVTLLGRIERSALCFPLLAVKAILCIIYYEHPDSAREISFDGRCLADSTEEAA